MIMETNIVLVLVIGLPGSGKTTLCKDLKSYEREDRGSQLIHFCYDDLIPLAAQREFVERRRAEEEEESKLQRSAEAGELEEEVEGVRNEEAHEEERNSISGKDKDSNKETIEEEKIDKKDSEKVIGKKEEEEKKVGNSGNVEGKSIDKEGEKREINDGKSSKEEDITENWKIARRKIHSQLDQLLHYLTIGNTDQSVARILGIPLSALEIGAQHIILLDDNFYYRSMRYEFYQLARKHSAAFCQLYLECSTEDAILRNGLRAEKVPVDVVTAMGAKLQPPQPDLNPWEGNTCVVNSLEVSKAWDAITKSFLLGLTPVENREAEIEEARKCCSLSVIHQADLTLRTIVKKLVKEELGRVKDIPASKVAGNVNKARKTVLQRLREGGTVPSRLADVITKENKHDFEVFLEAEMRKRMSE